MNRMTSAVDTATESPGLARTGSTYYPMLVAAFTTLVIISNVAATKGVAFGPIITDGGFIVFPLTYIIGDILFWVTVYLPAADFYPNQEHLANVVGAYTQLIIAGLAGFLVGQTINAWAVVKIKERTREKHLWARLIGSTFAGQLGDTLVFCAIAAPAIGITTVSDFLTYAALGWAYKTVVEIALLPLTYAVIAYIKRREPTYSALM